MNYARDFRKKLAKQNADRHAEAEAKKPKPKTPEELRKAERATAEKVCNALTRARRPPGYAKAGTKGWSRAVAFASETLAMLDDAERMHRFAERAEIFQDLVDDLNSANWSSGGKALVMFPVSEFAAVRGEAFTAPPDSSHWPLSQPDGPITWQED